MQAQQESPRPRPRLEDLAQRSRVFYFSSAKKLGTSGLIKVTGEALRVRTSMRHSVGLDRLLRDIAEESHGIFLWIDEAQGLPEETLAELRALAESDIDGTQRIQVLPVGLPRLRVDLQVHPHLWRRIVVREEFTVVDRKTWGELRFSPWTETKKCGRNGRVPLAKESH
ncbi:MAG: hypothetical protein CSA62_14980 [Planctomycetota bacterium]|nr:MAG: hypothetical protein CSA62_14980 [Planctomycetota bacterium]